MTKNAFLKEIYVTSTQRAKPAGSHILSRPFRQESIANLFGLASYHQVQNLQEWAATAADTEEQILHVVDQQYTFINKTADKVNEQEIRLNELSGLTVEWAEKLKNVANQTAALSALLKAQEASLSLLHGSMTLLEFTAELRVQLDEEVDRAKDLIQGRVPLTLLSPTEFRAMMEEARSLLPPHYSFSASPADMALSLASATITVITLDETSPYYGVLEFPIHREIYQLYQVQAIRVSGANEPSIMGQYEISDLFLAVSGENISP